MLKKLIERVRAWVSRPTLQKLISARVTIAELFFRFQDRWKKLDFKNDPETSYEGKQNHPYAHGSVSYLELLISESKQFGEFEHFVDIGCGKGRMVLAASTRGNFQTVIGIDYSGELIEIAQSNIIKMGCNASVQVADAREYRLPKRRALIYLFNPFGEKILDTFLTNNLMNIRDQGSLIVYHNRIYEASLLTFGFKQKASKYAYNTSFYWL